MGFRERSPPVAKINDDKNAGILCLYGKCCPLRDGRRILEGKIREPFEVFSAGTLLPKVSMRAIMVMQEIGIDISHHHSKILDKFVDASFDIAVTLCDNAHAICPVVCDAKKTIHHGFFRSPPDTRQR